MKIKRRSKYYDEDNPEKKKVHGSRAYRKYFEDYEERTIEKNGKVKTVRVYVGEYQTQNLTKLQSILLRLGYVLLFILSLAFFILGSISDTDSNLFWLASLSHAAAGGCYLWTMYGFIDYLTTGRNMTKNDYRTASLGIVRSTTGAAIALGSSALIPILWFIIYRRYWGEILISLFFVLSALFIFSIRFIEKRVKYTRTESENE